MELLKSYAQLIKYGITGVFGTVLYMVVLVVLVEKLHVPPTFASCLSFSTTVGSCFFINSFWTFQTRDTSWRLFVKYTIGSGFGLFLTTAITYVGVDLRGIW